MHNVLGAIRLFLYRLNLPINAKLTLIAVVISVCYLGVTAIVEIVKLVLTAKGVIMAMSFVPLIDDFCNFVHFVGFYIFQYFVDLFTLFFKNYQICWYFLELCLELLLTYRTRTFLSIKFQL